MKLKGYVMAFMISLLALAWLPGVTPSAMAKGDSNAVVGTLSQFKVAVLDGKETLQPGDKANPGDLIEYQIKYSNQGDSNVNNLMVTLPIPKGLQYIGAMVPKANFASLDGVKFEAIPLKRTVRTADGKEVVQEVPLSEYRALRWDAGLLGAGKATQFSARARVEAIQTQATKP
jgi:uncharacterized repeat protein (TIGR01451 family)